MNHLKKLAYPVYYTKHYHLKQEEKTHEIFYIISLFMDDEKPSKVKLKDFMKLILQRSKQKMQKWCESRTWLENEEWIES